MDKMIEGEKCACCTCVINLEWEAAYRYFGVLYCQDCISEIVSNLIKIVDYEKENK